MSCFMRPCQTPGMRMYDKEPEHTYITLTAKGEWAVFKGVRWWYEPVEIVGDSPEEIAKFIQAIRNKAPDVEGHGLFWRVVNSSIYMTLDRRWVMEAYFVLLPRHVSPFGGDGPNEPVVGPLWTIEKAILEYFNWFLGGAEDLQFSDTSIYIHRSHEED